MLLLYLWNAYFTPQDWVWSELIRALRLSMVLGVALLVTTPFSRAKFQFNGRVLLMFLFLGQCALSWNFSEHREATAAIFGQFFRILVITYLMTALVTDSRRLGLVVLVIGVSLGFEAAKQGWVQALTNPGGVNSNPILFLGDNNVVAVGMFMLTPLLVVSGRLRKTKTARYCLRFLAVGVVLRALTTYSRAGFLTGCVLAVAHAFRNGGRRKVHALAGLVVVVSIVLAVLPQEYWDRMDTINTWREDASASGRVHFWRVAVEMGDTHPFTGVGFTSFRMAYDKYDFSRGAFGAGRDCHSSWFGVLAELGYVGLVLFVLVLGSAFLACRRVCALARANSQNEELQEIGQYAAALRLSLIAFFVGGSFVSIYHNEMMWHLVALSMVVEVLARKSVENVEKRSLAAGEVYQRPGIRE